MPSDRKAGVAAARNRIRQLAWRGNFYRHAHVTWLAREGPALRRGRREPAAAGFRRTERVVRGAMLAPLAFPDVTLGAADFLG